MHRKDKVINALRLPLLLILLAVSVYGVASVRDRDIYKKIGDFELRPYKDGLYLTVPGSGFFYNFSPKDAYFMDKVGNTQQLISSSDNISSNESQLIYSEFRKPTQIYYMVSSYFKLTNPTSSFNIGGKSLVFSSKTSGNKISIRVEKNTVFSQDQIERLVMGLSFNEEDYLFDENGNLYNFKLDTNIADFNKILNLTLKPLQIPPTQEQEIVPSGVRYLFITNNAFNGVIRIKTKSPFYTVETIILKDKIINFNISDKNNPVIEVEIFNNLEEALKNR